MTSKINIESLIGDATGAVLGFESEVDIINTALDMAIATMECVDADTTLSTIDAAQSVATTLGMESALITAEGAGETILAALKKVWSWIIAAAKAIVNVITWPFRKLKEKFGGKKMRQVVEENKDNIEENLQSDMEIQNDPLEAAVNRAKARMAFLGETATITINGIKIIESNAGSIDKETDENLKSNLEKVVSSISDHTREFEEQYGQTPTDGNVIPVSESKISVGDVISAATVIDEANTKIVGVKSNIDKLNKSLAALEKAALSEKDPEKMDSIRKYTYAVKTMLLNLSHCSKDFSEDINSLSSTVSKLVKPTNKNTTT